MAAACTARCSPASEPWLIRIQMAAVWQTSVGAAIGATYREHPASVETIETHFAWVFLCGERAYKLKKPVNVPGMDLSTLEARRLSCAEELRLNRRLAPDVYLDVVPLVRAADATLRVGAAARLSIGSSACAACRQR